MSPDFAAARAFIAVAHAGGFRGAASATGLSASYLSGAVKRLESQLGVRLFHRTTRHVALTEAGGDLLTNLRPAMADLEAALQRANDQRNSPTGTLRLNVPLNAARLVLPRLLPGFLRAFPDVRVEVTATHGPVDILAEGYDAGIRYDERLTKNMVRVPIGPARQRFATAASANYIEQRAMPGHPRDLLDHACLGVMSDGGVVSPWSFERDGEIYHTEPMGSLAVNANSVDLAVAAALDGVGIVHLFEDWLEPYLKDGRLRPILKPWWQTFTGPYLYHYCRDYVPAPLAVFVKYLRQNTW